MAITILTGCCLSLLQSLPAQSVHTCVTSPPYWGLRDYGITGQLGLEQTPTEYVAQMVAVFREVWRVLRDDGTLWLNLGDSYAGYHGNSRVPDDSAPSNKPGYTENMRNTTVGVGGLKPKDLVGIPWRTALALQDNGWFLRSDIIWSKPNPMPESVTDRPTKSHEYLFLLSKSERYYFDAEAIKEPSTTGDPRKPYAPGQVDSRGDGHDRGGGKIRTRKPAGWDTMPGSHGSFHRDGRASKVEYAQIDATRRNKRSVWTVPTRPFPEAHFATYPPELIEPCILAGCPSGGTVLDPFFGAGTTGLVADRHGRHCIGIELNSEYVKIAEQRLRKDAGMFADIVVAA